MSHILNNYLFALGDDVYIPEVSTSDNKCAFVRFVRSA